VHKHKKVRIKCGDKVAVVNGKEETKDNGQEMDPSHIYHHGNDQGGFMDEAVAGLFTREIFNHHLVSLIKQGFQLNNHYRTFHSVKVVVNHLYQTLAIVVHVELQSTDLVNPSLKYDLPFFKNT